MSVRITDRRAGESPEAFIERMWSAVYAARAGNAEAREELRQWAGEDLLRRFLAAADREAKP